MENTSDIMTSKRATWSFLLSASFPKVFWKVPSQFFFSDVDSYLFACGFLAFLANYHFFYMDWLNALLWRQMPHPLQVFQEYLNYQQ